MVSESSLVDQACSLVTSLQHDVCQTSTAASRYNAPTTNTLCSLQHRRPPNCCSKPAHSTHLGYLQLAAGHVLDRHKDTKATQHWPCCAPKPQGTQHRALSLYIQIKSYIPDKSYIQNNHTAEQ
jgi:hypothetical protein